MLKTLPFVATKSLHTLQRDELISMLSLYFGEDIFRMLLTTRKPLQKLAQEIQDRRNPSAQINPPKSTSKPTHKRRVTIKHQSDANENESVEHWLQKVSDDVKIKCIRDYRNSIWKKPWTCAVCARDRYGIYP